MGERMQDIRAQGQEFIRVIGCKGRRVHRQAQCSEGVRVAGCKDERHVQGCPWMCSRLPQTCPRLSSNMSNAVYRWTHTSARAQGWEVARAQGYKGMSTQRQVKTKF